MALAMNPFRVRGAEDSGFKSHNLWVGSLTTDTTETDLTELFGRFGVVDRVTVYSSRSFAFIYYRRVEEAVAAKEALQGASLNGSQIKIEYARPAKPCKSLWVGGISPSVSRDDLEAEFRKFGKIEDFRFLRERKTAFIDYYEIEDALQAKSMNGKRIGGSYLCVDFLRSQAPRKEQWAGSYDNRNDNVNHKPQYLHSYEDGKGDGQPSNVLWIGYPPSVQIDEQMLHNAMILFGEIERKKSYPSRHFSLVEFRSVEEARRAKEGLQGRLFNDSRITIMYSNDGIPAPIRPGSNESSYTASEPNWRRPSPTGSGIFPSPSQDMRHTTRSKPGYDPAQVDRESKRIRRDGSVDGFTPMGLDAARPIRGYSDSDYMWRGVISKGGTPVCQARCVPLGKGFETILPDVVNCSARTGLDMLAKHYTEANEFEIVFFLPDREEDFASYTEFLRYLASKNRAGVAKLDDGTTLFLVPPSDFLTDVLKVSGPERLYGVVLKLASPAVPVTAPYRQESQSYMNQPRDSLTREDYNRGAPARPSVNEPLGMPQAGVSLTPELLATLASFLPATSQPTASEIHQPPSAMAQEAWERDPQTFHDAANQYNPAPQPRYQGQSVNLPQNTSDVYSQASSHHSIYMPNQNYGPISGYQQAITTNQVHNQNPYQGENANLESPPELHREEDDKNQRYQSTLQFAANLLLQIQQKQHPSSTQAGQEP